MESEQVFERFAAALGPDFSEFEQERQFVEHVIDMAFLAGFDRSAQGFNGEHGATDRDRERILNEYKAGMWGESWSDRFYGGDR